MDNDQENICKFSEVLNTKNKWDLKAILVYLQVHTMSHHPTDIPSSRMSLPIDHKLRQSFMLQDLHQHSKFETTNIISNIKKVSVSQNFTKTSFQSHLESMNPQSPTCLSNTSSATQMSTPSNCTAVLQESSSYQSKLSKSNFTGPIPDTISRNEDLSKKIKVKMQTTYETGK